MNNDTNDSDTQACANLDVVSVPELLDRDYEDIEVPDNAEVVLSPSNPDLKSYFNRVQINEFMDLQSMGLLPKGISENHIRRAIKEDDNEAFELAKQAFRKTGAECCCTGENSDTQVSKASPVRMAYNHIRRKHNPALAQIISEHYEHKLPWDSPVVVIARNWLEVLHWRKDIVVAVIGNITIGQNATMRVSSSTKSLLANHIWIHSTGRLVSNASYLKIWANVLERKSHTVTVADIDAARKIVPVWKNN